MTETPKHDLSTAIQEETIPGREPTHEELELIAWGEEMARKGLATVHDGLKQMVTLTTALLAGSTAMLGTLPIPTVFKALGAVALLVSLASSLWGSFPREIGRGHSLSGGDQGGTRSGGSQEDALPGSRWHLTCDCLRCPPWGGVCGCPLPLYPSEVKPAGGVVCPSPR
jgi:hypothetical protein